MSDFLKTRLESLNKDDFQLSEITFTKMRDVIYKMSGIYYNESKKYLLESGILKELKLYHLRILSHICN